MARRVDWKLVTDLVFFTALLLLVYYLVLHLLGDELAVSMSRENKKKLSQTLARLKLAHPGVKLDLNEYEKAMLPNVVMLEEIESGFEEIGGLEEIIDELREAVLYPLMEPEMFLVHLLLCLPPKGVLLYGPPGCGKTMLAKALAKELGATFISVQLLLIMDKWYGELNKHVEAIFLLAHKLEPAIVFIDEIDLFLRGRLSTDHEITAMLKAEFMSRWDGLLLSGRVIVLGATNRPNDIDAAFMRRMPKRFAVLLPTARQREQILRVMLVDAKLDLGFSYGQLVAATNGLLGSDLKEMCRNAAMQTMREYIRTNYKGGKKVASGGSPRGLTNADFHASGPSDEFLPGNRVAGAVDLD